MFNKKLWISRIFAVCLSASLMIPMVTYATEPDAAATKIDPVAAEEQEADLDAGDTGTGDTDTGDTGTGDTNTDTGEGETPSEQEQPTEESAPPEETATEEETPAAGTNENLIASQQIVAPPVIEDSFRFVTIEKVYAIVQNDNVNVYADQNGNEESIVVGTLQKDNLCYIIKEEEGNDWIYIESGAVRGFVKVENLLTGEEAAALVSEKTEESFAFAEALVDPINNEALTYTQTTTQQTVIDKVYAVTVADELNIREGKGTDSRIVGELSQDSLCYVIADAEEEWVFIESNDVRGFVQKEFLIQGDEANAKVEEVGEENFQQAVEVIPIEENKACYYTLTSIKEGVAGNAIRSSMLEFAQQFLGNPYVWGGTSLTNGTDCSGFVQGIYAQYGYSLPRTSGEQSKYGTQIPVESAAPGDLIFYAKNGVVYHVVMYMGDGQVIHASSSKTGIITSGIDTAHAVWATRIIADSDTPNIQVTSNLSTVQAYTAATAADIGEYLGEFKLTAYCPCSQCCGQWADGITASGLTAVEGRTVAMAGVPFGTRLVINGMIFTVDDRGTPYGHVDIYMNDHDRCNIFGVGSAKVYLAK